MPTPSHSARTFTLDRACGCRSDADRALRRWKRDHHVAVADLGVHRDFHARVALRRR